MQGEVVASAEAPIAVAAFERLCPSVFPVKRPILVQIVQICVCVISTKNNYKSKYLYKYKYKYKSKYLYKYKYKSKYLYK